MRIRLIIFDLDGTLIDSLGDLAASMNAVLSAHDLPIHPQGPYRFFIGDGITNLVRRALPPSHRSDELVEVFVEKMRLEYAARKLDTTRPYPGIPELLSGLSERGIRTAVLSNKPDGPTNEIVSTLLPTQPFDLIRGARPDIPLKPDPTAALAIASRLDVAPAQVVFVGDTGIDMQTARGAGMVAVGVTWGFRAEPELRDAGTDHVINRPGELIRLVNHGPSTMR